MSKVEVEPDKLREFAGLLGDGGDEAADTHKAVTAYAEVGDDDTTTACRMLRAQYLGVANEAVTFYDKAATALKRAGHAHREMAGEYAKTDDANADRIGSEYRDDKYVDSKGDPDEEAGTAQGRTSRSAETFAYVRCGTTLGDPDEQASKQDGQADPSASIDIPELRDYPEAIEWAASWGMDVTYLVLLLSGDWQRSHAEALSLRRMAKINRNLAGNVVDGSDLISHTWKGASAEASRRFTGWIADNIAGCDNTLKDLNHGMSRYIHTVDGIAKSVAERMGWFLWEADWAVTLECPSGPGAKPAISNVTLKEGLAGVEKAQKTQHLRFHPDDFHFERMASWAADLNQYVDAAYLAMVAGLMEQYTFMYLDTLAVWDHLLELTPTSDAAVTDLEQASGRLDAFHDWGDHDPNAT